MEVIIGEWVEAASRDVNQCPSYYAADWETLRTRPGRYPVRLTLAAGYLVQMPYWVLVKIPATRIAGRLYSGMGGHNFASQEMPVADKPLAVQMYAYQIGELVAAGKVELAPEYAGLADDYLEWARSRATA